ncbi:MAG: radical SAM protein [Candidatus Lernaella stagnicola]|nr:radical SAM protein [Candidatus Lernaella stagnicola]
MDIILLHALAQTGEGPPETNVTGVFPPLGLATLAGCLREAGHTPRVLDAHALRLTARLAAAQVPDDFDGLLVFSTTTLNWRNTLALIRACRRRAPRAVTVVGGPHLDLYPEETASSADVDFAVVGEGDTSLPALAEALANDGDALAIPGVVRSGEDGVEFGPPPQVVDLDQTPLPAWDLMPLGHYRAITVLHPFATMVSGRGCPFHCRFCSQRYAGGSFHRMSPARLTREWLYLVKEIGVREIVHFDETFAMGEDYLAEVAARVTAGGGVIPNNARSRCDTITPPLIQSLARIGTHTLHLGIEAGSDEALARMNKGITVAQVRRAVAMVKDAGLLARGYFMLAYPDDTPADALRTIELARSLPLDAASFTLTVLNPGTAIYEDALARGEIDDYWSAWAKSEPVSPAPPRPRHSLGGESQLRRTLRRAYVSFYLRPAVWWNLATQRRLWRWIPSWLRAVMRRGR